MAKIKAAEIKQQATKMAHNCHNSIFSQKKLPIPKSLFPTAVASNQPPCINPWKRTGETLDTKESPIGLRKSSAMVNTR